MVPMIHPPRVGMSDTMEVHLRHETDLYENRCGGDGFRIGSKDMLKVLWNYYPYFLCSKCFTEEDAKEHKLPYGSYEGRTVEETPELETPNTPFTTEGGTSLVYSEA
jgi:hypothetical protein